MLIDKCKYQVKFVGQTAVSLSHKDDLLLGVEVGETYKGLVGRHELTGGSLTQLELHHHLLVVVSLQSTGCLVRVNQSGDNLSINKSSFNSTFNSSHFSKLNVWS